MRNDAVCEGSVIIAVTVASGYSGEVVVSPECRDGERTVESGETLRITREERAGSCSVEVVVDGESVFDDAILGNEDVLVEVDTDGNVSVQKVEM
jgi:hypothetical protein